MKNRIAIRLAVFTCLVLVALSSKSPAATYTIADGDVTSLIAAINASNASPEADTINLAPNGTYTLTYIAGPDSFHGPTGLPVIQGISETEKRFLTINGNGSTVQRSTDSGTPDFRIFHTLYANVIFDGVIVKGGRGSGSRCGGGGFYFNVSNVIIRNSTITENWGLEGGGICNNNASNLTIENSTISYNTGVGARTGGAILNFVATLSISNSTLYENQAAGNSGFEGRGDAVADAFSLPGSIVMKNSIVANPTRGIGDDCIFFTNVSQGHNIFSDTSCNQSLAVGDIIIPNLSLGVLTNNGGLTPTHALLNGSPAIDAIGSSDCTTINGQVVSTDQRNALRPAGSGCDIGAFEFNGSLDGLVSYWPGEDHTNDVVGPNNGTFQNGSAYAQGIVGRAFSLDGVSQYIVAPDSTSLSRTGSLTLEAWIKITSNNRQQAIIEKYDVPALNGYFLRITDSGKVQSSVCDITTCSQPPATGATTVSTNTWHHVAGVYDGTSIKVYLDGNLDGVSATTFIPTDGATSLKIGARGDDANTRLGGLIDEVRIYNRARTGSEIAEAANLDSTPPTIVPTIDGTLGNNGWYTSDVEVSWTVSDNKSAVTESNGCDTANVVSDTSGITFTCAATSSGGENTQSVTIKRDATAPTIAVSSPTSSNYLLNQAVAVNFSCADNLSGVASCSGSIPNGGNLDTSAAGSKTFTANATDNAGNAATTTVANYTVRYAVQVLFDTSKAHKSGSTVPIKVRLVDANGNNVSSSVIALHALSVIQVSSQASTVLDDAGNSNPDYDFRYDAATSSYIFNLKTTGYSTGSYMLNFSAGGASAAYSVAFQVRS